MIFARHLFFIKTDMELNFPNPPTSAHVAASTALCELFREAGRQAGLEAGAGSSLVPDWGALSSE